MMMPHNSFLKNFVGAMRNKNKAIDTLTMVIVQRYSGCVIKLIFKPISAFAGSRYA